MKKPILDGVAQNLQRVRNLVKNYETITGKGKGRRGVQDTDILRAAVVFLHASLEEFLREIERWKLPTAASSRLDDVPLQGISKSGRPEKFFLGKLADFRGQKIDDVITKSVDDHLARSSYNNLADISAVLELCGVKGPDVDAAKAALDAPLKRRHLIVHQADRQKKKGKGFGGAAPIKKSTVDAWITAVEAFAEVVGKQL